MGHSLRKLCRGGRTSLGAPTASLSPDSITHALAVNRSCDVGRDASVATIDRRGDLRIEDHISDAFPGRFLPLAKR